MTDDLKSRIDAVLARRTALDKDANSKAEAKRRKEDERRTAEAKRQKEIYQAWSAQNDRLKTAVVEINRILPAQDLEFKLVRDRDLKRVGAKTDLRLFESGEEKLCVSITLTSDGAVKVVTKRRIFGTRTLSAFNVHDSKVGYSDIMVGLLEQLYPN